MTNKAKTYLKNIQEADTEKKLIGIGPSAATISEAFAGRQKTSGTACGITRKR